MQVKLKRTFIFGGSRYRRGTHEFPEGTKLPKDAVVIEEPAAPKPKGKAKDSDQEELKL